MPKIRKMKITDGDGNEYKVEEELDEELSKTDPAAPKQDEQPAPEAKASLTDDEIKALKDLAACAPQLMALTKKDEDPEKPAPEAHAEDEEEEEEIIEDEDPEEDKSVHDSFSKHAGKSVKRVKDSASTIDTEADINSAWSKRFGGE